MLFIDSLKDKWGNYNEQYYIFLDLFFKKPKLKKAKLISSGIENIKYVPIQFKWTYNYFLGHEIWVVELNNKLYALAIRRNKKYFNRERAVICRYYPNGKPKRNPRTVNKVPVQKLALKKDSNTKNACQIHALAAATGVPYNTILSEMKERGWDHTYPQIGNLYTINPNTGNTRWSEVLGLYGKKMIRVWQKSRHDNTPKHLLKDIKGISIKRAATLLPKGTFIIVKRGHVLCIKDNTIFDLWNSSNGHVLNIWQVLEK